MITYYKSQIVPNNRYTIVYWCEDDKGNARDISLNNIPKGAKIIDVDSLIFIKEKHNHDT